MNQVKDILQKNGVVPTPVRILVYKHILSSSYPLSLSDLESFLETVDKSSISRTLKTLKEHKLIHCFNDGSSSMKYEVCRAEEETDVHDDLHVHFRCESCGHTICFNELKLPVMTLPSGYTMNTASYIISGTCPECSQKSNCKIGHE